MKKILLIIAAALLMNSCGIYSFSGTSIQPDVKSVTIPFAEYKALRVNPSLSNDLTEAMMERFRRMTKLEQVEQDGDLLLEMTITGYDVSATAVTADEVAARNRLTVTVSVNFTNRQHPDNDFSAKSFSAYSDYDSTNSLDSVESTLCKEIIDKLIEDIFNASVAQW
ncbi:MAG: LptE family protein [Bacteroidales bacterium]|nr:LptE family protein [Bacteroidales bacterium]